MRHLIERLAKAEDNFHKTRFLAPRLRGGQVRVRVQGLISTYRPIPEDFEGWGVFQAQPDFRAQLLNEAERSQVDDYLKLLPSIRLILVRKLKDRDWLAYPANRGDFRQKLGTVRPVVVHLVTLGKAFQQVIGRFDGRTVWFDKVDRAADPKVPSRMAQALKAFLSPKALRFSGLTPELREAYRMLLKQTGELRVRCDETRLRRALEMGGGRLESYVDQGEFWTAHWTDGLGEHYTSAIQKRDLTVMSAGICLDGEDAKFDLQSLVGVVEQA